MTETDHLYLDRAGQRDLRDTRSAIPALAEDIAVTIAREDRMVRPGNTSRRAKKLSEHAPVNIGAMEDWHNLHAILTSWVRMVCEDRGLTPPENSLITLASWIDDNMPALAKCEGADEAPDEIASAANACRRHVDLPRQMQSYHGPCTACGGELWGHRKDAKVVCRQCGTVVDRVVVDERIERLLEQRSFTAIELVGIVHDRLGMTIKPKTVHDLAYRRINPIGVRGRTYGGQNLYNAGDVIRALAARRKAAS